MITNIIDLKNLLPYEMQVDGYTENGKKFLSEYSDVAELGDTLNEYAKNKLSVFESNGEQLDKLGALLFIHRVVDESDYDYRIRIEFESASRKVPSTIPGIQEFIDSIRPSRSTSIEKLLNARSDDYIRILDGPLSSGEAVVIAGPNVDIKEILAIVESVKHMLPAGVRVGFMISYGESWQDVKDRYLTWQDINIPGIGW